MKIFILIGAVSLISLRLLAQEKTFVKEYTYKASEADSKVTCRAIAINQLRAMLLNEIGVYVESNQLMKSTELGGKFNQDFTENISTISAGVTKLDVLGESWNGETFWMKAAITVDTTSLQETLKKISEDRKKVKELSDLKQRLDDANKKMAELNQQLNEQKELANKVLLTEKYNAQVNSISATNSMYNGRMKYDQKDFKGAVDDLNKVVTLDPKFLLAYAYRGHAKTNQGNYAGAIADFNKVIELNPTLDAAFIDRGRAKYFSGDFKGAIADFTKAIAINSGYALAYGSRGEAKLKLKNYAAALTDFDKAIQLDADYAAAYFYRGITKNRLKIKGACTDWNKAAQLNSTDAYDLMRKFCR